MGINSERRNLMKSLCALVPDELHTQIRVYAIENHLTLAKAIEAFIRDGLERAKNVQKNK